MRPWLKFLHTIGSVGLMGSMAVLVVMLYVMPAPSDLTAYAATRAAMAAIAKWIFFPSLGVTLIAGLIAIAWTKAYHNAGWAWVKAISGVLIFESGFVGVLGPIEREAAQSAKVLAGLADAAKLGLSMSSERMTLIILIGVCAANIALGVWRPRLQYRPK